VQQSLSLFLNDFWSPSSSYLLDSYPNSNNLASYWYYAQAYDTVEAVARLKPYSNPPFSNWIISLYNGQNSRGWFDSYFDDMDWMCLALIRSYEITGNKMYLNTAISIYEHIQKEGWDTSCCGAHPGGIWWNLQHTQKATASNAGPVISGLLIYNYTRDSNYLNFATKVYDHWRQYMVDDSTGQITDHINSNGQLVWWSFTYNQGLMAGAALALYSVTKNSKYINDATLFLNFMCTQEVETIHANNNELTILTDHCSSMEFNDKKKNMEIVIVINSKELDIDILLIFIWV